jgi:hypothetical protein
MVSVDRPSRDTIPLSLNANASFAIALSNAHFLYARNVRKIKDDQWQS